LESLDLVSKATSKRLEEDIADLEADKEKLQTQLRETKAKLAHYEPPAKDDKTAAAGGWYRQQLWWWIGGGVLAAIALVGGVWWVGGRMKEEETDDSAEPKPTPPLADH
jgi:hypothetical protein